MFGPIQQGQTISPTKKTAAGSGQLTGNNPFAAFNNDPFQSIFRNFGISNNITSNNGMSVPPADPKVVFYLKRISFDCFIKIKKN